LKPSRRSISDLDCKKGRHHGVADDDDDQIGGKVVSPLWRVILSADFAAINHLEIFAE